MTGSVRAAFSDGTLLFPTGKRKSSNREIKEQKMDDFFWVIVVILAVVVLFYLAVFVTGWL